MGYYINSFEDFVDAVKNIGDQDQKDLAEEILVRFYEKGWEVTCINSDGTFTLEKSEIL